MNGESSPSANREERLDAAIAEYLECAEAGSAPDREAFLARYPDLADDFVEFLGHRERLQRLVGPSGAAPGSPPAVCPQCHGSLETAEGRTTCGGCGWLAAPPPAADPVPHHLGRIELTAVVGRGAFGTGYKGWDPKMRRDVAVKVIRHASCAVPEYRARFLQDPKIAAQLDHPGIVTVHDIGEADGVPYMVSEFVPGRTLADLIRDDRPPPLRAAAIIAAVADALEHAHRRG